MPAPQNVRRWIMTLSISAITFTGAIYGAGLKTKQELHGVSFYSFSQESCNYRSQVLVFLLACDRMLQWYETAWSDITATLRPLRSPFSPLKEF